MLRFANTDAAIFEMLLQTVLALEAAKDLLPAPVTPAIFAQSVPTMEAARD